MKKRKIKTQFRQGDILIEAVEEVPSSAVKQKPDNGRIIVAHGEVTGHHHSLEADLADWWKEEGKDALVADQFVSVQRPTALVHQEHARVPLNQGTYRVRRQREYSPEAIRNVAD